MSSTSELKPADPTDKSRLWRRLGWVTILSALAYVAWKAIPHYFVLTPESYGNYFWPKVAWLLPHVICGLLAVILGPLQFWPRIRRDYLPFHRIAGRLYCVAVLVGTIASLGMSTRIGDENAAYAWGLIGMAVAWVTTTGLALVAIRRKNVAQHQQWMIRSYVVTFAFVTFRLLDGLLQAGSPLSQHERLTLLAWGSWALPLLFTEVVLQMPAIRAPGGKQGAVFAKK